MRRFWLKLTRRRRMQQDLEAELEFHRQMAGHGRNPLRVGGIRDEAYDLWRFTLLEDVLRDALIGARMLARTPIFTLFAALVLAVTIGVNISAFSLISAIVYPPIDVPNADRFVRLYGNFEHPNTGGYAYVHRAEAASFVDIAGYLGSSPRVVRIAGPNGSQKEMAPVLPVTGNLFRTFGIRPELGRFLTPADAIDTFRVNRVRGRPLTSQEVVNALRTAPPRAAVLSDEGWQHYFGRDLQVLGKSISIGDSPYSIVGIAPAAFTDALKVTPDGWGNPLRGTPPPRLFITYEPDSRQNVNLVGRLKPGVSRFQAESELAKINLQAPKGEGNPIRVMPGNLLGPAELWVYIVLLAAIGLAGLAAVLMIACDNIAILLSAKTEARRREIGIRLALGASRAHIVRQLIAENLLLSVLGGAGAVFISLITARIIERLPLPFSLPDAFSVTFNWRALLFAVVVSFLTTILFGLRPALQAVSKDVVASLNPAGAADRRPAPIRSTLVVTQITVSTALLLTMLVMVKSQHAAIPVERNSEAQRILVASFNTPVMTKAKGLEFYETVLARLRDIPQIASASAAALSPAEDLANGIAGSAGVILVRADSGKQAPAQTNIVMEDYFKTMGISLRGRDFSATDGTSAGAVVIVNDTFAERVWPNQNPIGRQFNFVEALPPPPAKWDGSMAEVVGLVHDGCADSGGNALPFVYFPLAQTPRAHSVLVIRSVEPDARAITGLVQRTVAGVDDRAVLSEAHTIQNEFDFTFLPNRIGMYVAGAPGILAFLLSIIGTYGTMALLATQRRREIGIRIALGAPPSSGVAIMLKQGMKWTAIGLGLGTFGALGILSVIGREFEGNIHILRFDSSAFAFGIVTIAFTAAVACYIPAKRVSQVNPIEVLRNE